MAEWQHGYTESELASEVWLRVAYYPPYQVSNLGRVRSAHQKNRTVDRDKWTMLRPQMSVHGYPFVQLRWRNRRRQVTVHILVAESFIGPRPPGLQINHKDGVKSNPRVENLEYVTPSENMRHATAMGLQNPPTTLRGSAHPRSKLTQSQADSIRKTYAAGGIGKVPLAEKYGVTKVVVTNILRARSYVADGRPVVPTNLRTDGQYNPMAKLTQKQASEIRAEYASGGISYKNIGKKYGICSNQVMDIVKWRSYVND